MKSNFYLLVIICLFSFTAGCHFGTSSPSQTVKNFYAYLEEGKVEDAAKLFSSSGQENSDVKSDLSSITLILKECGGIESLNIQKEIVVGEVAEVSFILTCKNFKTPYSRTYKLIKEAGEWKLDAFKKE